MHKESFGGSVKNWWGKPITELKVKETGELNTEKELKFANVQFDAFGPAYPGADGTTDTDKYTDADWAAAYDEMAEQNELPTKKDIVTVAINKRKATKRQKAMADAVTAAGLLQPTAENDPQIGLRDMVRTLLTAKNEAGEKLYTEEQARALASKNLGVAWKS